MRERATLIQVNVARIYDDGKSSTKFVLSIGIFSFFFQISCRSKCSKALCICEMSQDVDLDHMMI